MKINTKAIMVSVGLSTAIFTTPLFAAFALSEYQSGEPYGNAQIPCFREALSGSSTLTAAEERQLAGLVPVSEVQRYYGRVALNTGTLVLDKLKNRSTTAPFADVGITRRRVRVNQTGLEFALGYVWSRTMRGEAEYLVNRNFTYNSFPAFVGLTPAQTLNVSIKNNTVLLNGYYDFSGYDRFRPFITAGLGLAANSSTSQLTPGVGSKSIRTINLAYQIGVGFRVSLFTRWFVTASYRYIGLGNARIEPMPGVKLLGPLSMSPFSLGVMYLF